MGSPAVTKREMAWRITLAIAIAVTTSGAPLHKEVPSKEHLRDAISHWIQGNDGVALHVVTEKVLPPGERPGLVRGENAALWNIGARILYEQYLWMSAAQPKDASAELRKGEIFAAAAVWEDPYNLDYWRDWVRIAVEQRVVHAPRQHPLTREKALQKLADELERRHLYYPDLEKKFSLTEALEMRYVGYAIVRAMQGEVFDAEGILKLYISGPRDRSRCAAAVALVELQMEINRFAAAADRVDEFLPLCTGAAGVRLAERRELFRLAPRPTLIEPVAQVDSQWNETVDVYPDPYEPYELASNLLRDSSRNEDWDEFRRVVRRDPEFLSMFDKLIEKILDRRDAPSRAVRRARAFRLLQEGEFEKARVEFDGLISENTAEAEILIGAVLIDTDDRIRRDSDSSERLKRAMSIAPHTVACIDLFALRPCLERSEKCELCTILCSDADDDLVYNCWRRGAILRSRGLFNDSCVRALSKRIELNKTLMDRVQAQLVALDATVEQQFAAYDERLDVIVEVEIPRLRDKTQGDHEKLEAALAAHRRDVERKFERQASDIQTVKAIAQEAALTTAQSSRMLQSFVAELEVLKAWRPRVAQRADLDWERMRGQIEQLAAAVHRLEKPEIMRNYETLRDHNAPADERLNAFLSIADYVADEGIKMLGRPHKAVLRLLKFIPVVKLLSDIEVGFAKDLRNH